MSNKTLIFLRTANGLFLNYDSTTGKISVDAKGRTWASQATARRVLNSALRSGDLPAEGKGKLAVLRYFYMTATERNAVLFGTK